jgi:8-oxo-dGTP diphosphatase
MEFGEDLENALIREVREEADLTITVGKLLYAVTFKTSEYRQVVVLTYSCTIDDNMVILSDEHKNYLWANKEEMVKLLSKPIVDDLNRNSVWKYIFTE